MWSKHAYKKIHDGGWLPFTKEANKSLLLRKDSIHRDKMLQCDAHCHMNLNDSCNFEFLKFK